MTKSKAYDAAKVALMLLVLFAHGSRMYNGGVYTPVRESFSLRWLTVMIYAFHMPAFFMLSGCLWGNQARQGKYMQGGRFLKRKAYTLLLPYLLMGICVVAPTMTGLKLTEESFWGYVCDGILLGTDSRHLGFRPALFWLFVLTVPLREILLSEKCWNGITVLSGCMLLRLWNVLPGVFGLHEAGNYAVFFFAGVYLDRYWDRLFHSRQRGILLGAVSLCVFGLRTFRGDGLLFYVFAFAGSIALFAAMTLLPDGLTDNRVFCLLRKNSFGIYLFHPMLIYLLFACTWYREIHPWVLCGGICLLALVASLLLSEGVRHLGLGFVLGERHGKKNGAVG